MIKKSIRKYMIMALIAVSAMYGGMRYERYFLTRQFQSVATVMSLNYGRSVAILKYKLETCRYPNSGESAEL